jgi:hypothetical protein
MLMWKMNVFLSGAIMTACLAVSLFFLRFWRSSRDRLFLLLSLAFALLGLERMILVAFDPTHEMRPYVYMVRMVAFVVLLVGIIDKNRRKPSA